MPVNPILGGGGFHHVCLRTARFDAVVAFYCDVLGFTEKITWREPPQRAIMLDAGDGNYLEVFEEPGYAVTGSAAVVHFALRTTRLDAVVDRVRAAGQPITMEPKDVAVTTTNRQGVIQVRIAFCEGPAGEVLELFQNDQT